MNLDALLKIVVCPECRKPLVHLKTGEKEGLACSHCDVVYPIREDIPILLVEEAIPQREWVNSQ